jgi:5-methylcytosine-specific restriction enzyme subunit McrC
VAHHRLFEWEARRFDADNAIPVGESACLVRAAQAPTARLKGKPRAFDLGRDALTAQNLVGIVATGDTSCEILPKVDRETIGDAPQLRRQLIRMLAVAHDLPIADDVATALDVQHETILEILIGRFVALLEDAVRKGMPRTYTAQAEDLPTLRGRLDVGRQFATLAASPHRLACRFDEFSVDMALNQVIKAAVVRLRSLARGRANLRALSELALIYADVSLVRRASLEWDAIVSDRNNARWMALVRLAKLILGDRFQNSAHGMADGFALLFDMNALFERYVAKLLEPLVRAQGATLKAQGGGRDCLHPEDGHDSVFATYPDLRLCRDGRVEMVIDTKWKRLADRARDQKMDVAQSDIYQVVTYAQLYRCDRLVLLYPQHGKLTSPLPIHYRVGARNGPIRLTIATVDVSSHQSARSDLVRLLADGAAAAAGAKPVRDLA